MNSAAEFKAELDTIKAQQQAILNFNSQVVSDLWKKRYESYLVFWKLTGFLPKYPRKDTVTYNDLLRKSREMRDWYFDNGGILLSDNTKYDYFKLQEEILIMAPYDSPELISIKNENGKVDEYEKVRQLFSKVRTGMTKDLNSTQTTLEMY